MNKLGFSVIFSLKNDTDFYIQLLSDMLTYGCEVIEVHTPQHDSAVFDNEIILLLKKFKYRSIHASDIVSYDQNKKEIEYYAKLITSIDAHTITLHPHTMQSWIWLEKHFTAKVSFENMDWRKPFGTSVADMQRVYAECPNAGFVLDLNHIYTNDRSMALAEEFHERFDTVTHYHVSGFKNEDIPHTTLYTTQQNEILTNIRQHSPVIIESLGMDDITDFKKEYDYIRNRITFV